MKREPIEWNRLRAFQDVTIRLIAEQMVPRPYRGQTCLRGELSFATVRMRPPSGGCKYHVYCSPNNQAFFAPLVAAMASASKPRYDDAKV